MLNNSTPLKFTNKMENFLRDKENITFNEKTLSLYEPKITYTSRNNKPKITENDDIIPRIINTSQKYNKKNNLLNNSFNHIIEYKSNENLSNNYYSINANYSLFNEQQSDRGGINENNNNYSSPKINCGKMTLSELNDSNKNKINDIFKKENDINNEEDEDFQYEEGYNKFEEDSEKIKLENFLNESKNKNIISQKENDYFLFDVNNIINNKKIINFKDNEKLEEDNLENQENKRNFFSKILDIEILIDSKEIYSKPWCQLINDIYNKLESNNDSIQLISLGSQHTLCISNKGKLYSFGWNNYSQCGKKIDYKKNIELKNNFQIENIEELNQIKIGKKISDINTGEDHSLIITEEGTLYGFGLNQNGQLCYNPNKHKIIKKPSLIKSFKKQTIKNIGCTDNISFILNNKGEAFICPWEDKKKIIHYTPLKLYFPYKPKISNISCGHNFSIFLSEKGNVYSIGSNNKYGQLGLGDSNIQLSPKIIPFFKNNKISIVQISCGYCHALALSQNGNTYSWGYGGDGQLGLGKNISESFTPKLINFFKEKEIIIYQISSGFHSSYFLNEKNNIYICGTNRDCNKKYLPKNIDIKIKYKDLLKCPYWICRILNCWNKNMSVFYAIFLDCHFINKDDEEVKKVLSLISKKWIQQSFSNSIMQGIYSLDFI